MMNAKWITAAAVVLSSAVVTSAASAAEKDEANTANEGSARTLAPATHAVELTVAAGYAQGFGDVTSGQPSLTEVGQAGGAVQAGVGYRLIPQLTLGAYGSGAMFARGDQVDNSSKVYSSTAGVQADWHFLPRGTELDPWISLGTGWRGYWIQAGEATTSMQGMELAKLQIGLDYRIDQAVAISPVIGADLSTFFTQSTPGSAGYANIAKPSVNTFLFAGVQGRFDIPTGSGSASQVASR